MFVAQFFNILVMQLAQISRFGDFYVHDANGNNNMTDYALRIRVGHKIVLFQPRTATLFVVDAIIWVL